MEEMQIEMIPMGKIKPNPRNPREDFDEEEIKNLAESIEGSELMNPISVRRVESKYEVIAGDRRFFAFQVLKMNKAPSIVREASDFEAKMMSAVENIHREDLDSIERENIIYELWNSDEWTGTQQELADKLGKSRRWLIENCEAASQRKKEDIPSEVTTRDISDVISLEQEDREKALQKKVRGEVNEQDLREFRRLIQNVDEEMKETLLKPGVTMKDARKIVKQEEMEEALEEKTAEEEVSEEEKQEWKEKAEKARKRTEEILAKEETQKKGKLRRNWQDLETVLNRIGEITCPVCGKPATEHLKFDCHDLTVEEAWKMARDEYQKAIKGGD